MAFANTPPACYAFPANPHPHAFCVLLCSWGAEFLMSQSGFSQVHWT